MTIKEYITGLGISCVLSWTAWTLILLRINPFSEINSALNLGMFYVTLFFGIVTLVSIILFFTYWIASRNEIVYGSMNVAFRQAFLVGLLVVGLLFFQGLRLLTWWNGVFLLLIVVGLECLILYRKS